MLKIGYRSFQPVRALSGFHVTLAPNARPDQRQNWRMDAYFVPDETDTHLLPWQTPELWRLFIFNFHDFTVPHWHDLTELNIGENEDTTLLNLSTSFQNMARFTGAQNPDFGVGVGSFRVIRRDGYLFTLEMDGEILPTKTPENDTVGGDFTLRMEIPFVSLRVEVPINASDPLATAQSIAQRELGLKTTARSHISLFNPEARVLKPQNHSKHTVLLETAWH